MRYKEGVYTRVTSIKKGVEQVIVQSDEIRAAIVIADEISKKITGKEIVITSIFDGKHSERSLHYSGNAFDIRAWIYTKDELTIISELKSVLGKNYDVVFETDHIHIEYDPKKNKK